MGKGQLILEFVKALAWPTVVLVLVLYFRTGVHAVLSQLADRLRSAESIKLGVMGQAIELSGTARQLLAQRPTVADPSVQRLNNPLADIIGLALLEAPSYSMGEDDILPAIVNAMGAKVSKRQQGFLVAALLKQIEPIVAELSSQGFVSIGEQRLTLTPEGVSFFNLVRERQQRALTSLFPKRSFLRHDSDTPHGMT